MARNRRGPSQRNGQGPWYTTIGRETVRVADAGASYKDAFTKMAEVLADASEQPNEITVKNLFRRFLEWTQVNRSRTTYTFYERYLTAFQARHGGKKVRALLPRHVEQWIESDFSRCSSTTRNDIMKAVNRAMNWGLKKRYLRHNPLIGMERPPCQPRETVLSPKQFRRLLSFVPDAGAIANCCG